MGSRFSALEVIGGGEGRGPFPPFLGGGD